MATTTLTIEMDADIAQKLQDFCARVGVSISKRLSDLIVNADDDDDYEFVPNAETLAAFAEITDMKRHPEKYKSYTDIDEMFDEILAEPDDDDEV